MFGAATSEAYANSPPAPAPDSNSNAALLEAARCVVAAWEAGDLATAVRNLSRAIETAEAT
jgi:hypothetical protein